MINKKQSLPEYILDEKHFKDFEYDFNYCIIHRENDTDYFNGTTASALGEYNVFQDDESLTYFIAVLAQSKMLISVDICASESDEKSILKLPYCKNDSYLCLENVNLVPQTKVADKVKVFSAFLSIREINKVAENNTFLYIDFETVFKWIKKHRKDIDMVAFDIFSKYGYSYYIKCDDFIKQIDQIKKLAKSYTGKNLTADLFNICLKKHIRK